MGTAKHEWMLYQCFYEMVKFKPTSCFKDIGIKIPRVLSDFFQGHMDESVGETGIASE